MDSSAAGPWSPCSLPSRCAAAIEADRWAGGRSRGVSRLAMTGCGGELGERGRRIRQRSSRGQLWRAVGEGSRELAQAGAAREGWGARVHVRGVGQKGAERCRRWERDDGLGRKRFGPDSLGGGICP